MLSTVAKHINRCRKKECAGYCETLHVLYHLRVIDKLNSKKKSYSLTFKTRESQGERMKTKQMCYGLDGRPQHITTSHSHMTHPVHLVLGTVSV